MPDPVDTVATLALYAERAAAIARDSARLQRTQVPVTLGAGITGVLHAWRAGPVWRRLRVEGEGAGLRMVDEYWIDNGVLLGARLEMQRADQRPAVDHVWFRRNALYRWTDATGRVLNPASRSTQFEVHMLRARFDTLVQHLTSRDAQR